ncbi:helix-turn-helix domain-containing protein [bacterium]|jgi:transcriptional regulator with XRE-family HTH domain|nr:helix-turn-helix domain-containing protein [bacterium]
MKSNNSATAGAKLRAWMTLNDVSVTDLASQLDVTRNTLYRWLKGDVPRAEMVVALRDLTGIKPGEWYR